MTSGSSSRQSAKVDVWIWSLDVSDAKFEELSSLLNAAEQARAARFFYPEHARQWAVCRGQVRQLLGDVIKISPTDIMFSEEEFGRPFLVPADNEMPSFNISHTGGLGALAISYDARVGVDIETVQPMSEDEMAWPLSPAERDQLKQVPIADRYDAFFRFWTLKEAFIKATGRGMSMPLEDFDMSGPGDGQARLLRLAGNPSEPAHWKFSEHCPQTGILAAVAARVNKCDLLVNWYPLGQVENSI